MRTLLGKPTFLPFEFQTLPYRTWLASIDRAMRNSKLLHAISMESTILCLLWLTVFSLASADAMAEAGSRYYFSGDGYLHIVSERNGAAYEGRYRQGGDRYAESAYRSLCRVFDAPYESRHEGLSLRLIEFIDYLQDRMRPGALITVTSGYRSPEYNTKLRDKGILAAKASLHQYGMAADLKIEGVAPRRIWEAVKSLGFGGTGYYHGDTVHIDVGPARSWDEKSSGVGTGISDDNKLIGLVADFDRYHPGDSLRLRFIRMTAFPITVNPRFTLIKEPISGSSRSIIDFNPAFGHGVQTRCFGFENIAQMVSIQWTLPPDIQPGRYRIHATFCCNPWKVMPGEVATPFIEVVSP